ncbi:ATP-binding protein [Brevibacillus centrosporus]|uniref:sensor histidine kinase n=1 Tax=Brevibacillus centrosporus TaxID=54910 RepID=UPI001143D027|nr:ATP-binding protein [Brevibacillus centrosporus]MEC2127844.1 ATP-binding protein [Brevibacillus centrosporus]GED32085.1 two-component sensor histidine kinase [Brevibacillus centrosporus]
MKSIWMRLALALMAVSASGILISTILSIKEMDYHFSLYVSDVNQQHQQDLLDILQSEYQRGQGWNDRTQLKLESASRVLGLQIALFDSERRLIRTFGNMVSSAFTSKEDMIPIKDQGNTVGYIDIRYDNSNAMSLEEHFQIAHTNAMQWTMLALLLLVCIASIFIAKRIARPIVDMSDAAQAVSKGDLSVRVALPQGKDELAGLVQSFNNLVQNLQRQDELRKRLTSDIAHELRTPLNTLLAQTEGMLDGIWESSPEHLEATRSEVLRLIRIVSDLDQVIQAEAGALTISHDVINLSKVAESIVDSMTASFQQKGTQITCHLITDGWIKGDKQRLAQVFSNLITNSFKHTLPGAEVMVSLEKKGRIVEVKVSDNGTGIPPEDLPFVFERFYRGDRSRNREKGGTGLGLTIVKGIVEAHHGDIFIHSEVGKGTTVTLRFPAAECIS